MNGARIVVVGSGLAGLACARRLRQTVPAADVLVLERATVCGGQIRTERSGGYIVEAGPDSFLTTKPAALALCRALGLEDEIEPTLRHRHRAFIRRDGQLRPIPEGMTGLVPVRLGALLRSGLLTLEGFARFSLDYILPPGPRLEDESVADFARRRFGEEASAWLFEPLLSGIYGGDATKLSIRATFPALHAAEVEAGSVLAGLREARSGRARAAAGARWTPFVTLRSGMQRLIEALVDDLGREMVRTACLVTGVEPAGAAWLVHADDGTSVTADAVVLAIPAHAAAGITNASPALSAALAQIPFESATLVHLAYGRADCPHPLEGHGHLNPRAGGGPVAACTWTSSKFAHRAPAEAVLLRMFLRPAAGADDASAVPGDGAARAQADAEAVRHAQEEARAVLGITAPPLWHHVVRWPRGMPQYTIGHRARLEAIDRALSALPGLFVTGNSYRGVGIPDTIVAAETTADRVRGFLEARA